MRRIVLKTVQDIFGFFIIGVVNVKFDAAKGVRGEGEKADERFVLKEKVDPCAVKQRFYDDALVGIGENCDTGIVLHSSTSCY